MKAELIVGMIQLLIKRRLRQVVRNTYGLKDATKWMSQIVIPY